MELFSEVFGAYYQMVSHLLRICSTREMAREEIQRAAASMGFGESSVYLLPKLMGKDGWPFLEKCPGPPDRWKSRLSRLPKRPLTLLERRWLSAVLTDPRAPLFLSYETLGRLNQALEGVSPLYIQRDFRYFDQYLDGDPYPSASYQKRFRLILSALREGQALEITFQAGAHGGAESPRIHRGVYIPLRLEYSEKDDKFRILCKRLHRGRPAGYATVNLGRVLEASPRPERCTSSAEMELMGKWLEKQKCGQPAEVVVSPERNGVERFLVEFSSYEKESWMEPDTGRCHVKIWYQKSDETEVLIRILGFGPIVQVLGPAPFLRQVKERVRLQTVRLEQTAQVTITAKGQGEGPIQPV